MIGGGLTGTSPTVRTDVAISKVTYARPQAIRFVKTVHREHLCSDTAIETQQKLVSKPLTPFPTVMSQ